MNPVTTAVRKFFRLKRRKCAAPLDSAGSQPWGQRGLALGDTNPGTPDPRYQVREQDLGEIHKAAWSGNVREVQRLLSLGRNDLDRRDGHSRTPLHLACANGQVGVVKVLVKRKCFLNLCDRENRTALMKAVQCQEEECVAVLLENGADPNVMDLDGNTALHYATSGDISIAEQLLSHGADVEARNKDDLTPLSLAINENKEEMVAFLMENKADIRAVDKAKSYREKMDKYKEELKHKYPDQNGKQGPKPSPNLFLPKTHNTKVEEISEEEPSTSLSKNSGPDDSWPSSDDDIFGLEPKVSPKPNLVKLLQLSQRLRNQTGGTTFLKPLSGRSCEDNHSNSDSEGVSKTLPERKINVTAYAPPSTDNHSNSEGEGVSETPSKGPVKVKECSCATTNNSDDNGGEGVPKTPPKTPVNVKESPWPAIPSSDVPFKLTTSDVTKEEETKSETRQKKSSVAIIKVPEREQMDNGFVTYISGEQEDNSTRMMSILGLGEEEEETESPWDSESIPESPPQKHVEDLFATTDVKVEHLSKSQDVFYIPSCMSGPRNIKMAKLEDTRNVGIPGAHVDSPKKNLHLKTTKTASPHEVLASKDLKTSKSAEIDLKMSPKEEDKCNERKSNESQVREEKNKVKSSTRKGPENTHQLAADFDDDGLIKKGKSEETGKRFPVEENEDSDGSSLDLPMLEVKKYESQNWTPTSSAVTPVVEKANVLCGVLPEVNTPDSSFSETDQEEGRPAKKTSDMKTKVSKNMGCVQDDECWSLTSETASEDCVLPNSVTLLEQLAMSCNDSLNLLKIQDAILSYERVIELKKNHCALLTRKMKQMETKCCALQMELRETKEIKVELENEKMEWEQELSNLRFALAQEEEKRRNADILFEVTKVQLKQKEEEYNNEVKVKQQLEHTLSTLDLELKTARSNLNKIVEERDDTQKQLSQEQNARILQDGILSNHLCKQKAIEMAYKKKNSGGAFRKMVQAKQCLRRGSTEQNKCKVPSKDKDDSQQNHVLQNKIDILTLEIETLKNQSQAKEKKYSEDVEFIKAKNDDLQKTLKKSEETFSRTAFQLNDLTAENAMLHSKLETEKLNKKRLETEMDSLQSRLAAAVQNHEQSQKSKADLHLSFQMARDELLQTRNKMSLDLSNLKENNDALCQQLSVTESKLSSLENAFILTKDTLREKMLNLERVQRDFSQVQGQMKEMERRYQNEKEKVRESITAQKLINEKLTSLQAENNLLQKQVDEAENKADCKERKVVNLQDQLHAIVKTLKEESKKSHTLEERAKALTSECIHLKGQIYQYDSEKAEREAGLKQIQQELTESIKKHSMSEASLEVAAHYRVTLEDQVQDLKKKIDQIRCQYEELQCQHAEAMQNAERTQDNMQKQEVENVTLKATIKLQEDKIETLHQSLLSKRLSEDENEKLRKSLEHRLDQETHKNNELEKDIAGLKKSLKETKKKLNEYETGDLCFLGDLQTRNIELESQMTPLQEKINNLTEQLETSYSKCQHLEIQKQALQQELVAVKDVQRKCGKLEKRKDKLEQKVGHLRSQLEKSAIDYAQVEQYKRDVEEKATQELVEKLKQVNLFLQTQAVSQENLEYLREEHNASMRSQMEMRMNELESELSKMKTSQNDSQKTETEKYKELYFQELQLKTELSSKLEKANERLSDISGKLAMEKQQNQQNQSFLNSLMTRPALETPFVGTAQISSVFARNLPREYIGVSPTSRHWHPTDNIDTYLAKMQEELQNNITRELEEDYKLFSEAWLKPSSNIWIHGLSNQSQT
ncbi:ankyrin repeat domain-containing protein 26 isoform X2 [Echinops telfairi]|uniref:Ankyrin repeat domain-containing protein 26 isoform X2 n=1 Tax=Echinops telfairi TaxID=9371 RepID=A0AC55D1Y7_ECHTE|nr:ankyrin repeat domain-containing protein 26 isoform X2 [Echinops telfairi]